MMAVGEWKIRKMKRPFIMSKHTITSNTAMYLPTTVNAIVV